MNSGLNATQDTPIWFPTSCLIALRINIWGRRVFLKENQEGWNLERSPGLVEQTNKGKRWSSVDQQEFRRCWRKLFSETEGGRLVSKGWWLGSWRNRLNRVKYGPLLLLRRLPEESAISTCGPHQAARGADNSHNCCPVWVKTLDVPI